MRNDWVDFGELRIDLFCQLVNETRKRGPILTTLVRSLTISESATEKRSPARDKSRFDSTFVNSSCIFNFVMLDAIYHLSSLVIIKLSCHICKMVKKTNFFDYLANQTILPIKQLAFNTEFKS